MTSTADLIPAYQHVLGRLWLLHIPPANGAVDAAEAKALLAELAKLCDELGPDVAAAVSRSAARRWARAMGRCPWCGESGIYHDTEPER